MLNEDYRDMLQALADERVRFLLVGAYALAAHGYPRATMDIDIWVMPSPENAAAVLRAIRRFGAPLHNLTKADLERDGTVFQIGVAPRRIDIITAASGLQFDQAFARSLAVELQGIEVHIPSVADLIRNKRASGRTKDLADAEALEGLESPEPCRRQPHCDSRRGRNANMSRRGRSNVIGALVAIVLGTTGGFAMGVEEAAYTAEKTDGIFQLRRYAPQVVAETVVDGTLEEAGNKAFRPLFDYISGANRSKGTIAMTAPVGQRREGQTIAMTAPVGQAALSNQWAVTFMMPTNYTLETLPEPTNPNVRLRAIPARRMAAVRYSGSWSRTSYEKHLARLREWMKAQGLDAAGEPVWARYNAPLTPWFLRRNEILVPLQ